MPESRFEYVRLVVGNGPTADFGLTLDTWESYEVTQNILHGVGSFNFRVPLAGVSGTALDRDRIRNLMKATRPDVVVRLEQGERRTLLFRGLIDQQKISGDRNGEHIEISGRDAAAALQDNECQQKQLSGKTLPQIADQLLERYRGKGIPYRVIASADANRDVLTGHVKGLAASKTIRTAKGKAPVKIGSGKTGGTPVGFVSQTVKDARPHPGETEHAWLDRHAKNLGVMMYFSAEGDLIFTAPDYSLPAAYKIRRHLKNNLDDPNNVLSGSRVFDTASTASAVHIYGHASGRGEERTQVSATVSAAGKEQRFTTDKATTSSSVSYGQASQSSVWPRERTIRDAHAKTSDQAKKLAQRELARLNAGYESFVFEMADHQSPDGTIYAMDMMADLDDEVLDAKGLIYITGRSIRKSRSDTNATTTTLQAVPKGAIVL
jgi:prophage tail gpP-like protein